MKLEATGKDSYRISWYTADGKPAIAASSGKPAVGELVLDRNEHDQQGARFVGTRTDERHIHDTVKSGKGTVVNDYEVSADGKTLTLTRKGTGATSGRPVDEILVFTKQ